MARARELRLEAGKLVALIALEEPQILLGRQTTDSLSPGQRWSGKLSVNTRSILTVTSCVTRN